MPLRSHGNWDYITQTPYEIYEKTSGGIQRPDSDNMQKSGWVLEDRK